MAESYSNSSKSVEVTCFENGKRDGGVIVKVLFEQTWSECIFQIGAC